MMRSMVLCLLACACGGSNPSPPDAGSGYFIGGYQGKGTFLDVRDAVFGVNPATDLVMVFVADRTSLCDLLGATSIPGETNVLNLSE